jgi:hypothetical protein
MLQQMQSGFNPLSSLSRILSGAPPKPMIAPQTPPLPPGQSIPSLNQPVTVPAPQQPNSATTPALSIARAPLTFADVPENYWAKPYIDALTAREILNGLPEGIYDPNRPLTRAELAAQLASAFEMLAIQPPKEFFDVTPDYWGYTAIQEAVATGFMTGYPAGDFRPNQTVTRLEVLIALATGLNLPIPPTPETVLETYQDHTTIPPWGQEKTSAVVQTSIISASPTTGYQLRPNDVATRAEVAVMIYRTLAYMGQVEPVEQLLNPTLP